MTTYNKIAEQIQRLYARQFPDKQNLSPALHVQEVRLLVNQVANELIVAEPKVAQRIGDISIPSCVIATYSNQAITSSVTITASYDSVDDMINDRAAQTNNLYYWAADASDDTTVVSGAGAVYKYLGTSNGDLTDYQKTNVEWSVTLPVYPMQLPMDIGVWSVTLGSQRTALIPISTSHWDLLSELDESLLEDQVGYYVEGRKIIFTTNPVETTAKVKLLINDITSFGGNDPFPLPPEMEATLIQRVLQLLTAIPAAPDQPKG